MLDLDPDGRLVTFRVTQRIDEMNTGQRLDAERIADHRRDYLTYEGPVSGDRGEVRRLATGNIEAMQCVGDVWAFLIRWDDADGRPTGRCQRVRIRPGGAMRWHVEVL